MSAIRPEASSGRLLIVTADDFGLTVGVNDAVEQAHVGGVLNTASLMVSGDAAADAVRRAHRLPNLKVGLHLVLVEGAAILPAARIPDLLDERGLLPSDQLRLGFRYFFRPSVCRQLAAEIRAQFEAFHATGLMLDHVNAHKHMHLHPTVARLMMSIGREFGLRAVRIPNEPALLLRAAGVRRSVSAFLLRAWTRQLRQQARRAGMTVNDFVFGIALSGRMTADRVIPVVANLPGGLTEMYFHPASVREPLLAQLMPDYEHQAELQCLLNEDLASAIEKLGIERTTWTEHSQRESTDRTHAR